MTDNILYKRKAQSKIYLYLTLHSWTSKKLDHQLPFYSWSTQVIIKRLESSKSLSLHFNQSFVSIIMRSISNLNSVSNFLTEKPNLLSLIYYLSSFFIQEINGLWQKIIWRDPEVRESCSLDFQAKYFHTA